MSIQKFKSITAAVCLLAAGTATMRAALVTIQQDVNLATTTITLGPPNQINQYFSGSTPRTISNGDSVSLTYNFLNGRLTMADLVSIPNTAENAFMWLGLQSGTSGTFNISSIQITFLDAVATGGAQSQFVLASQSSGSAHLGPALQAFLLSGSSLNFSGIQATYTVDSIPGGTDTYVPWLILTADQLAVTPVPEPSTYIAGALLLLPFGAQAVRRLRTRKQVS
jgi:hypothetical protein